MQVTEIIAKAKGKSSADTTETENTANDKVVLWDHKTGEAYVEGDPRC